MKVYLLYYTTPNYVESLVGIFKYRHNAEDFVNLQGEDYKLNCNIVEEGFKDPT